MLAWKIYMKNEFILYTGYKIMGPEAMNGNNKIRTEGTALGILRKNKLIGSRFGTPHYIF